MRAKSISIAILVWSSAVLADEATEILHAQEDHPAYQIADARASTRGLETTLREAEARGADDARLAAVLDVLADRYRAQYRFAEAEAFYKRSLAIFEKTMGPEHPNVGTVLNVLVGLYQMQGRDPEAEPLLIRSRAVRIPRSRDRRVGPVVLQQRQK